MMYPWKQQQQPYMAAASKPVAQPQLFFAPSTTLYRQADSNADTYRLILIVALPIFVLWDWALAFCNYGTVLKFLGLNDVKLMVAAGFFILDFAIKLFSIVVAILTLIMPTSNSLKTFESIQIVTIITGLIVLVYSIVIGVSQLMPGTVGGLAIDTVLHIVVAGFSALLWKEYPHDSFAQVWMMVPQQAMMAY